MLLNSQGVHAEADVRNRFVRRVCETGRVWAVAGSDGLARVKSQRWKGRDVTLLWSEEANARKWASTVADRPRLKELSRAELLQDVLPVLANMKRFVGPDWGSEPIEPEVEARDISERVRVEAVERFVRIVSTTGVIWMLEGVDGPGLLLSGSAQDRLVLPCWSDREEAERHLVGPFEELLALLIPIDNFLNRTLPWLEERGRLVAPEFEWGGGAIELEPGDLRFRLHPDLRSD
jgi:hypothetical protein